MGAGDWDITTGAKPLTPDKDERLIYALISIGIFVATIVVYCLASTKHPNLYNFICGLLVVNLNTY